MGYLGYSLKLGTIFSYEHQSQIVGDNIINNICGDGCVHHKQPIPGSWFQIQLSEVMPSLGNTKL
jgi:hypothetical protein